MKLRLNKILKQAVLAGLVCSVAGWTTSSANTVLLAEGINISNITQSERFYDTGKGYYFGWGMHYWPELEKLRKRYGSFSFLGDVYDRIPSNAKDLDYVKLTDDAYTCWAQVSMNLVEYWHSYYGVFCKDSRKLVYGRTYDKSYLDEAGGTLSLKQNLVFLDVFSNDGDILLTYLDWLMLGDDVPYYSTISKKNQGGYWNEYFPTSSSTRNFVYTNGSISTLSSNIISQLGYKKQYDGTYSQTIKGQLVYLGLSPDYGEGHAITCHGAEIDENGQVSALYVTNSDDMEYKLFKLYVRVSNNKLYLYTNKACTTRWEYADKTSWHIEDICSIKTPVTLQNMLAEYEDVDNPLRWTGSNSTWKTHANSNISRALPTDSTGWKVRVTGEDYPIYYLDAERKVLFDDSASSGAVTISGTTSTAEMVLNNQQLAYSFSGDGSDKILADTITANTNGTASFSNVGVSGSQLSLRNYTLALHSGAGFNYTEGNLTGSARLQMDGGSAEFTTLTLHSGTALEMLSSSSLTATTLRAENGSSFLFSASDAVLTFSGQISANVPISLVCNSGTYINNKTYALITFQEELYDWESLFSVNNGLLSFSGNTLYFTYVPVQLTWSSGNGTWAANTWKNAAVDTDFVRTLFSGSSSYTVNISGQVTPAVIEVTNTGGTITFNGSGSITGDTRLLKSNAGTLVINTANSYTGGTVISGGTVQTGNSKALGTGGIHLQNASLDLNKYALQNAITTSGTSRILNGGNFTGQLTVLGGILSGDIRLTKDANLKGGNISANLSGNGQVKLSDNVTLSGNNSYTGNTYLNSAQVLAKTSTSLGSGNIHSNGTSSISVSAGAILSLHNTISNTGHLTLSGNFDATAISRLAIDDTHIDISGTAGTSGFNCTGAYSKQIIKGGTFSASSAKITSNGNQLSIDSKGVATYTGTIDYSSYLITNGGTAGISDVYLAAAQNHASTPDIILNGGTLEMNSTLKGELTLNSGTLLFTGTSVHVSGNLSHDGHITIQLDEFYLQDATYTLFTGISSGITADNITFATAGPRQKVSLVTNTVTNSIQIQTETGPSLLQWHGDKKAQWAENAGYYWKDADTGKKLQYISGDHVEFTTSATISMAGNLEPGCIYVSAEKAVTFTSDKKNPGYLSGKSELIKTGAGTLTINTNNRTWTGNITIESGTLKVGNAGALGHGDIILMGGTLDLAGKEIDNAITISGSACIKGGAKYKGKLTLDGDLLKGSVVNFTKSATLNSGTINGTLSGTGSLKVTGAVTLGDSAKVTSTGKLTIEKSGELAIGSKGLTLNAKLSSLVLEGGKLTSAGKLSGYELSIEDGATLTVSNAKPMAVNFKGGVSASGIIDKSGMVTKFAEIGIYGAFTATELDLTGSKFTLEMNPNLVDSKNQPKAQSITINGKGTDSCLDSSEMIVAGKMSVTGDLTLQNSSSLTLYDSSGKNAAMPLDVKGSLTMSADSELSLNGKLGAASMSMSDSDISLSNEKAQSITLSGKGVSNELTRSSIIANASMSVTGDLRLSDSEVSLKDASVAKPKAMGLTVKGALDIRDSRPNDASTDWKKDEEVELLLSGKLSAGSLTMENADITLSNEKAQSIALTMAKDAQKRAVNNTLNNSRITANASMSVAGNLELSGTSSIHLWDANTAKPKALNLAVKGNLTLGSGSSLTLSGALSAANLTLDGGSINLTGTKPRTIKVSNQLVINSGTDINFNFTVTAKDVNKKAFKILTFKTIGGYDNGDFVAWTDEPTSQSLLELLGLQDAGCTLTLDVKKKNISLTVNDLVAWEAAMEDGEDDAASEETPTPTALAALPVVPDFSPVADALVQANWGQVEASRAFVNTIATRSNATQLGSGERAVWGSAIIGSSRFDSAHGHNGADTNVTGGAMGLETQLSESSLLGVALGASRTRVSAHNYGTIKQDTTHLGLYGQTRWSKLSADWNAAYGRSDSEIHDNSWKQNHLQLDGRVSYNHALSDSTVLRGFGGMQYYASDSARVNGIATGSIQNLRAEIGVGASHAIGKLGVYGEVAVQQDIVRHNPHVATPDARYNGVNPGRMGLNFTVGASYSLTEQWSVNASYTGEVVENANAHSANVGATYKF